MKNVDPAIKNFPTIVKGGVVYLDGSLLRGTFALAGLRAMASGDLVYAEAMVKAASLVGEIVDSAK